MTLTRRQRLRLETARSIFDDPTTSKYSSPPLKKIALIENEFLSGFAVVERRDNVWRVLECSKEVQWLKDLPVYKWKLELLKRGCRWDFRKPDPPASRS